MTNIMSLGPWGPFERRSQPRWFTGDKIWLGLTGYQQEMVQTGASLDAAKDIVARLRQHGCERIFWRYASGGRKGTIRAMWDVRVATTETLAETAVPAVISLGPPEPGTRELVAFSHHPAVIRAYSASVPRQRVYSKRPVLGGLMQLSAHADSHCTHRAFAALARGNIGATISTAAQSQTVAESALSAVVETVLHDIDRP